MVTSPLVTHTASPQHSEPSAAPPDMVRFSSTESLLWIKKTLSALPPSTTVSSVLVNQTESEMV